MKKTKTAKRKSNCQRMNLFLAGWTRDTRHARHFIPITYFIKEDFYTCVCVFVYSHLCLPHGERKKQTHRKKMNLFVKWRENEMWSIRIFIVKINMFCMCTLYSVSVCTVNGTKKREQQFTRVNRFSSCDVQQIAFNCNFLRFWNSIIFSFLPSFAFELKTLFFWYYHFIEFFIIFLYYCCCFCLPIIISHILFR